MRRRIHDSKSPAGIAPRDWAVKDTLPCALRVQKLESGFDIYQIGCKGHLFRCVLDSMRVFVHVSIGTNTHTRINIPRTF
jgi:hypothetical protein